MRWRVAAAAVMVMLTTSGCFVGSGSPDPRTNPSAWMQQQELNDLHDASLELHPGETPTQIVHRAAVFCTGHIHHVNDLVSMDIAFDLPPGTDFPADEQAAVRRFMLAAMVEVCPIIKKRDKLGH